MGTKIWGSIVVLAIFFFIGVLIMLLLLTVLDMLKIVRFKKLSHLVMWSMLGSLLLNFIVIGSKNGCGKKESDAIRVETSKTGTIK
jgi:hypothetical protein